MYKKMIEEILYQEEVCNYTYVINKKKYENYQELLLELAKLKMRGKCKFNYDNIQTPLLIHCVYVEWKAEDEYVEFNNSELINLLKLSDSLIIDETTKEWQLSVPIYQEI